jgi:hypothetical protein
VQLFDTDHTRVVGIVGIGVVDVVVAVGDELKKKPKLLHRQKRRAKKEEREERCYCLRKNRHAMRELSSRKEENITDLKPWVVELQVVLEQQACELGRVKPRYRRFDLKKPKQSTSEANKSRKKGEGRRGESYQPRMKRRK